MNIIFTRHITARPAPVLGYVAGALLSVLGLVMISVYGGVNAAVLTFYTAILAAAAVIDIRHKIIPNRIVYPALPVALILAAFFPLVAENGGFVHNLLFALAGCGASFVILFIPAFIKESSMGWGDVKFAALIGIMSGFPGCLVALGLGIVGAGLFSAFLLVARLKRFHDVIPFGPFLAAGAIAALLWGEQIINWYLALAR